MPHRDYLILMGMGGFFTVLGLVMIFWGKSRERRYYDSLSTRLDVREYLEHWPPLPGPTALKIGGRTAIAVGLVMIVIGSAFWLWG